MEYFQWRMQDFPDGGRGANPLRPGQNHILVVKIFAESTWKWKKITGGRIPISPPPPSSANDFVLHSLTIVKSKHTADSAESATHFSRNFKMWFKDVEDNVRKRAARFLLFSFDRFSFSHFIRLWFFVMLKKHKEGKKILMK